MLFCIIAQPNTECYYTSMKQVSPWMVFVGIMLLVQGLTGSRFAWVLLLVGLVVLARRSGWLDSFFTSLSKHTMAQTINIPPSFKHSVDTARKAVFAVIGAVVVIILLANAVVIVEAGYTGVYALFGKVRDRELSSGFHVINPLANVTRMSIRTEEFTMSIQHDEGQKIGNDAIAALTKEGLSVDLDITVLYHLDEPSASDVFKNVGLDYEAKIIRPEIRSVIREVIAQYEAKDIYSEKRQEAAIKIAETLTNKLGARGIVLEDVLLRNVQLPDNLSQSIQEKLQAEQDAQKYDFLLQQETKEAERKRIEAAGQRDAQAIINESLTPNYLYFLYLNELADREGTIYVPTSPDTGLPLFRNLGQ